MQMEQLQAEFVRVANEFATISTDLDNRPERPA